MTADKKGDGTVVIRWEFEPPVDAEDIRERAQSLADRMEQLEENDQLDGNGRAKLTPTMGAGSP